MKTLRSASPGFTLLEAIVTLVVASIAGVMLFSLMNPGVSRSAVPVLTVQDEGQLERVMEWITGDYVLLMNQAPATALATLAAKNYAAAIPGYPADVAMTREYLSFNAGGAPTVSGPATSSLRVTLTSPTHRLAAIFSATRTDAADPRIKY